MSQSDRTTKRGNGTAAFLSALNVRRNAIIGLICGIVFASLVYSVRVFELLGPAPDGAGGPVLFLALAFVLAFGVFVLVTLALTLGSAVRRSRELS